MKEVQEGQSSGLIIDSAPNMLFSTGVEKLSRLEESHFHEINIVNGINYFKRILSERAKELERAIVEISSTSENYHMEPHYQVMTTNPNGHWHCGTKQDLSGFTSFSVSGLIKPDGKGLRLWSTLREKSILSE